MCFAKLRTTNLGIHVKDCPSCKDSRGETLRMDKNISACICMYRIFLNILATGERPPVFIDPSAKISAGQTTR